MEKDWGKEMKIPKGSGAKKNRKRGVEERLPWGAIPSPCFSFFLSFRQATAGTSGVLCGTRSCGSAVQASVKKKRNRPQDTKKKSRHPMAQGHSKKPRLAVALFQRRRIFLAYADKRRGRYLATRQ